MTTELKAKDFLVHYLKKEYIKRSKVLNNLVSHVERLHKDYALTNIERTRHLKTINELVKMLNNSYKSRLDTIKGVQSNDKHDDNNFEIDEEKVVNKAIKLDKITNLEKNLSEIIKFQKNKDTNKDTVETNESNQKINTLS
jgi:hypothetical protein